MSERRFHIILDNQNHKCFCKAVVQLATSLAPDTARRLGCALQLHLIEACGDQEKQLKQAVELGRTLAPDTDDLVGLMPLDSDALPDLLKAIYEPIGADKHSRLVCAVLHHVVPAPFVKSDFMKGKRFFRVAADQLQMGRLQAQQISKLLERRRGDRRRILYITGPEGADAVRLRVAGAVDLFLQEQIAVDARHSDWNQSEIATAAVADWHSRGGSLDELDAVAAHNDMIADGAKRYLVNHDHPDIPVVGMDGTDDYGKRLVDEGILAATVVQPLGVEEVLRRYEEFLLERLRPSDLPEDRTFPLRPTSYPTTELQPLPPRQPCRSKMA